MTCVMFKTPGLFLYQSLTRFLPELFQDQATYNQPSPNEVRHAQRLP